MRLVWIKFGGKRFSVHKFNSSKDYYSILKVNSSASQAQIKKSFRSLAKQYHPDTNKGNQQKFKQINQAYQILSDPAVKKDYDLSRSNNSQKSQQQYSRSSSKPNNNNNYYNTQYQYQNYRGYTRRQGWDDPNYREQMMHNMYRQQQQQLKRQYHQRMNQSNPNQKYNQYYRKHSQFDNWEQQLRRAHQHSQKVRVNQQKVRQAYQAAERRREEQLSRMRTQAVNDLKDKASRKINQMAAGLADNIKGFAKVAHFVKDLFSDDQKNSKNKK